tara:strand:- start:1959 stop:3830 length:1872 start_codon:yes stop_codon:yes gene_type:complete
MAHSRTSPSLPVPAYADPADQYSIPVLRNGIQYIYDKTGGAFGTGEWEAKISKNVNVVTKVTDQSYEHENNQTTAVPHKPNEELLTIPEIDGNFISLKQGIVGVEKELKYIAHDLEAKITSAQSSAITSAGNASAAGLALKANIGANTFTGAQQLSGSVSIPIGHSGQFFVHGNWVQTELQNLSVNLTPYIGQTIDLGNNSNAWRNLYVKGSVLPTGLSSAGTFTFGEAPNIQTATYYNVNLGSQSQAFEELYVKDAFFSGDTITIGEASLSSTSGGGVLLPLNSSIGTEDNEIPANFANTLIEERFAESATENLQKNFQVSGQISFLDPVKLFSNGAVGKVNTTNGTEGFVGFAAAGATGPSSAPIIIHGLVNGFSNLTAGGLVYITDSGAVTQTKSSTTVKVGVATTTTQIFLFSTSAIDTYVLNELKIDRSDLSVINNAPSGNGSLSYSSNSGIFSMTFPDLSPYATQTYVNNQIDNIIDGAPGTLDTLNEIAAAINDNENFATSITQSIAARAPLANPAFTGVPTAPTPATTSNDTTVATTAFVKQQAGSQTLGGLTDVVITSPQQNQVIAYDSNTNAFRNVNQSGVGGTGGSVNFVVDGGTATSVSSDVIIFLDGGSA